MRQYNYIDHFLQSLDSGIRSLFAEPDAATRPNPADNIMHNQLTTAEQSHSAALMRINHAGELSAQGLYHGQALTARSNDIRHKMAFAAAEETDHLAWCQARLSELQSHTSYLAPFWYLGSYAIGATVGIIGDNWSLGFVAETERQVVQHLQDHLKQLAAADQKSRAIILQMQEDEAQHALLALAAGGKTLPWSMQLLMRYCSKIMTTTAYWI